MIVVYRGIKGLYKDHGKENGNYYNRVYIISGFSCHAPFTDKDAPSANAPPGAADESQATQPSPAESQDRNPDIIFTLS